ncbi:unnamed protein product [Linum trigynum]|uniref:DUF674 domain-containing protein n=1 Tax=Linum trigynum TaxID=586398 RepID=A0AAV2F6Z2_9ROSI
MASSNSVKMKLKLIVDKKRNKVIYAEAQKDFVDLLIYLLSLPLSAVVKYLDSTTVPGSIGKLHRSVDSIMKAGYIKPSHDDKKHLTAAGYSSILVPHLLTHVPILPRLTSASPGAVTRTLYNCQKNHRHVKEMAASVWCMYCGTEMNTEVEFSESSSTRVVVEADYVKDMVPYMVADDLSVSPLNSASVFASLDGCHPGDMVEEKEVQFGSSEVISIYDLLCNCLNAFLHSKEPLTAVFLKPK